MPVGSHLPMWRDKEIPKIFCTKTGRPYATNVNGVISKRLDWTLARDEAKRFSGGGNRSVTFRQIDVRVTWQTTRDSSLSGDAGRGHRQFGRDQTIVPVPNITFDSLAAVTQETDVGRLNGSVRGNGVGGVRAAVRFLASHGGREKVPYPQRLVGARQRCGKSSSLLRWNTTRLPTISVICHIYIYIYT